MILNINDFIKLKKLIKEKYNIELHLHDTCSGQYFTLNSITMGVKEFINKHFKDKHMKVNFSDDGLSFYIN